MPKRPREELEIGRVDHALAREFLGLPPGNVRNAARENREDVHLRH